MDVIALHQAGFTNAVASLGTALTPGHAISDQALCPRRCYLTYDSDDAGYKSGASGDPDFERSRDHDACDPDGSL